MKKRGLFGSKKKNEEVIVKAFIEGLLLAQTDKRALELFGMKEGETYSQETVFTDSKFAETIDNIQAGIRELNSAISAGNQSNYYTNFCENALFYGSMVEACHFNKNSSAAQVWEAQYQNEIILLANRARRNRRDDMETVASPAGSGDTMRTGVT